MAAKFWDGSASAISADMSRELAVTIRALPDDAWQVEREDGDAIRQWSEVAYVPSDGLATKDRPAPPRYLALRITKKQDRLFARLRGCGAPHPTCTAARSNISPSSPTGPTPRAARGST